MALQHPSSRSSPVMSTGRLSPFTAPPSADIMSRSMNTPPPSLVDWGSDGRPRYVPFIAESFPSALRRQRRSTPVTTPTRAAPPLLRATFAEGSDAAPTPSPSNLPTPVPLSSGSKAALSAVKLSPKQKDASRGAKSGTQEPAATAATPVTPAPLTSSPTRSGGASAIQTLPWSKLASVVADESASVAARNRDRQRNERNGHGEDGGGGSTPVDLHRDFDRGGASMSDNAWTKLEEAEALRRRAARFRVGVKTPPTTVTSIADGNGSPSEHQKDNGSPVFGGIRTQIDLQDALRTVATTRTDPKDVDALFAVKGQYKQYLLRHMLEANGMEVSALVAKAEGDASDTAGPSAALATHLPKFANVVASSDACLEAAVESGQFSPTRLFKAREMEAEENNKLKKVFVQMLRAQEAEEKTPGAFDEETRERIKALHSLVLEARNRTEKLSADATDAAGQPKRMGSRYGLLSQSGFDDDSMDHALEARRLADAYYKARSHHSEAIATAAENTQRACEAAKSTTALVNREAFERLKRRIALADTADATASTRSAHQPASSGSPFQLGFKSTPLKVAGASTMSQPPSATFAVTPTRKLLASPQGNSRW